MHIQDCRASGSRFSPAKEPRKIVGRDRAAQEKTLHLVALEQPKEFQLFLGLDSFRNDFESEGMGQRNDRRYDGPAFRTLRYAHDERPVDLERVHRQSGQVIQR